MNGYIRVKHGAIEQYTYTDSIVYMINVICLLCPFLSLLSFPTSLFPRSLSPLLSMNYFNDSIFFTLCRRCEILYQRLLFLY